MTSIKTKKRYLEPVHTQSLNQYKNADLDSLPTPLTSGHQLINKPRRSKPATTVETRNSSVLDTAPTPLPVEKEFSAEDFQTVKLLGKGSFGTVNLVRHLETGQLFASKILTKAKIPITGKRMQHVLNERDILQALKGSPFAVQVRATFQDSRNLYILMEYLSGGELLAHLKRS